MVHNLVPVHLIQLFETLADLPFAQPYKAYVSAVQLKMVDQAWIPKENYSLFFVASYQVILRCYSGYLTFLL